MACYATIARYCLAALLAYALLVVSLSAQVATQANSGQAYSQAAYPAGQQSRPTYRVAERSEAAPAPAPVLPQLSSGQAGEHPLMPVLRWAYTGVGNVEKLQDYSATLVKRERVGSKVGEYDYMFVKVRQKPFSVYIYFLSPQDLKGQEVIYVQGQNNGNLLAHTVGIKDKLVGTVPLKPDGVMAMRGNRYPLTEIGILNLIRRLVEVGEQDVKYGECNVKFYKGAKINNRVCTCIEVVHPTPRRNFLFHLARIFVDDELNIPIRYESYDWPKEASGTPELIEEYTYLNLKLNNGFTDADFDIKNPNYKFH
jgi:outer membrane lipoprotein-sorting protein